MPEMVDLPASTPMTLEPKELTEEGNTLYDHLPPLLLEEIRTHVEARPDFFGVDEKELHRRLHLDSYRPNATDNRLRLNFWLEFDRSVGMTRTMNLNAIVHGVCTRHYFINGYIKHPQKIAWLLCPPASYTTKTNEALEFGLEQLRDILEASHSLPNGRVDTKLGELKAKIVMMLDQRVKGSVPVKNLNVNVTDKTIANLAQENTMEALERQLKELEARERRAKNLPMAYEDISVESRRVESNAEGTPS